MAKPLKKRGADSIDRQRVKRSKIAQNADANAKGDRELAYLESKLGLHGDDREANLKKLQHQLVTLDGFDEDLFSFIDDCLDDSCVPTSQATTSYSDDDVTSDGNERSLAEEVDEAASSCGTDSQTEQGDLDAGSETESDTSRPAKVTVLESSDRSGTSANMYVPPAARTLAHSVTSVDPPAPQWKEPSAVIRETKPLIIRLVNRIAEGNLTLMGVQLAREIFEGPLSNVEKKAPVLEELCSLFAQQVIQTCIENLGSTVSLVASQTACLVVLSSKVSYIVSQCHQLSTRRLQVCQTYLLTLIRCFERNWNAIATSDVAVDVESNIRSHLRLAATSFALLYDFGVLHPTALFSFVRRLFQESAMIETQLDLLLSCLRHAGIRLRAEAAEDFRDIMVFVFDAVKPYQSDVGGRVRHLLAELEEMKNNKHHYASASRLAFVRSWVQENVTGVGSLLFTFPAPWTDLASGKAHPLCPAATTAPCETTSSTTTGPTSELLRQAAELRLHTDLQKSVYVAVVGAEDPSDAVQRTLQVAHTAKEVGVRQRLSPNTLQIPHAVAVLLHTSLQERLFNPYYPHVLLLLAGLPSNVGQRYRKATKEGVIAQLSIIHEYPLRQLLQFAQVISYLCLSPGRVLDLKVIRFGNFGSNKASGKAVLFLKQVCRDFCQASFDGQESERQEQETVFDEQLHSLRSLEDLSDTAVSVISSMLLPEFKKAGLTSAVQRARRMLKILSA